MPASDFEQLFASFKRSAFRLQLLSEYSVEEERSDFERYLAGKLPSSAPESSWMATMRDQVARGRSWTTVHLLPATLTPYLHYLIDRWYTPQAAVGARIGFVGAEHALTLQTLAPNDFWLFDDMTVVLLAYDAGGRFQASRRVTNDPAVAAARRARDFAVSHAKTLDVIQEDRRNGRL